MARVHIGRVAMSIHTKLQNTEHVIEALCRAKLKFPGCQMIHITKNWGFTKFNVNEFENMEAEKWLVPDGCGVEYNPNRGPLDKWRALHSREPWHCLFLTRPTSKSYFPVTHTKRQSIVLNYSIQKPFLSSGSRVSHSSAALMVVLCSWILFQYIPDCCNLTCSLLALD